MNKESCHDNNEEEKFEKMKEEANRIRQKDKKDRTDEERKKFKSLSDKIARYKKKIRDSGKKWPVLEQNEENKFKNMEKEANEILLKKTIKEQMRKRKNWKHYRIKFHDIEKKLDTQQKSLILCL